MYSSCCYMSQITVTSYKAFFRVVLSVFFTTDSRWRVFRVIGPCKELPLRSSMKLKVRVLRQLFSIPNNSFKTKFCVGLVMMLPSLQFLTCAEMGLLLWQERAGSKSCCEFFSSMPTHIKSSLTPSEMSFTSWNQHTLYWSQSSHQYFSHWKWK